MTRLLIIPADCSRYTSQEACDKHMNWPPVQEFLKLFEAEPGLFGGPPEIWHSEQKHLFTRPELANYDSPFVVLAKLSYTPEGFAEALEGWEPVFSHAKSNEKGVLSYSVGKDVEHEDRLTLVEAYESEKYLMDVHFVCPPLSKKLEDEERLRSAEPEVIFLKHVAGYWCK
jgi:quinol monooxygenase YgiN